MNTRKFFTRLYPLFICIWLFCFCTSCFKKSDRAKDEALWMAPNGKVKVLCTTQMVSDLVKGVGGDLIDTLTLIQGESDPHSYQLVKGDDEKFVRADIIFYSGLGLEHGPSLAAVLKGNSKAHALSDYIRKVKPEAIVFVGKTVDPHLWMDVSLWKEAIPYIVEVLIKEMPIRRKQLQTEAANLDATLAMLHAEIRARLFSMPEQYRYLVTTHDAFNYFGRAYLCKKSELASDSWRKRVEAPEGLAPDSQLSTADIAKMVSHIMKYKIGVIFAEANVSRDSIVKIADACKQMGHSVEIATTPLYADSMGSPESGAGTYEEMMRYNSEVINNELRRWQLLADAQKQKV